VRVKRSGCLTRQVYQPTTHTVSAVWGGYLLANVKKFPVCEKCPTVEIFYFSNFCYPGERIILSYLISISLSSVI
jgi:hypothetical protein